MVSTIVFNNVNYQILIDKEQNELRINTLSSLENGSEVNRHIVTQIDRGIDFVLCRSCFWCASYFNFGEMTIITCPMCHSNRIDQLPVSIDQL
jgi:hypothetical protein